MELEKMLKDDFLKQIYYGEVYLSRENPDTPEYQKILQKIRNLSEKIRRERGIRKYFEEYNEAIAIKESMETELHFKLGFKTAVRLLVYGLNDKLDIE